MEKKYTKPVTIKVNNQVYNWTLESGLLADKDDLKANANEIVMRMFLADLANEYGAVFPAQSEGPFLDTDTFSLYTVVYLFESMFAGSKITYEGEVPTLTEMGLRPLKLENATVVH